MQSKRRSKSKKKVREYYGDDDDYRVTMIDDGGAAKHQRRHCLSQFLGLLFAAFGCWVLIFAIRRSRTVAADNEISVTPAMVSITSAKTATVTTTATTARDGKECVKLVTELGDMVWKFRPDGAPQTVRQFQKLIDVNFFDGMSFYRAEKNFCLQGGATRKDGTHKQSPLPPVKLEYKLPNAKGFISTARTTNPDSANTEFSIMLGDNSHWLGPEGSDKFGYAVFAQVVEGWSVVQHISEQPTTSSGGLRMLEPRVEIVRVDYAPCPAEFEKIV